MDNVVVDGCCCCCFLTFFFFDRYERINIGFVLDAAFDLNHDNRLSWSELHFWYLFALREHPDEINILDDLRGA